MKENDVIVLQQPRLTVAERFYLPPILAGLARTLRHLVDVLFRRRHRVIQYPEQRREDLPAERGGMLLRTYHGLHRLNRDEAGRVKCVACFMCSTACPAHCIHIVAAEAPWPDRDKYPVKFEIDELRCIYCGMCEEACPVNAIELTHEYDAVGYSRAEMVWDMDKLLAMYDRTADKEPM